MKSNLFFDRHLNCWVWHIINYFQFIINHFHVDMLLGIVTCICLLWQEMFIMYVNQSMYYTWSSADVLFGCGIMAIDVFIRSSKYILPCFLSVWLSRFGVPGYLGQGRGRRGGGRRLEEVREVGGWARAEGGIHVNVHRRASGAVVWHLSGLPLGLWSDTSEKIKIQQTCGKLTNLIVKGRAAETLEGRFEYKGCLIN